MKLEYLKGVTTLAFSTEKCSGCGKCEEVCPHGVYSVADKKARITCRDWCMECGACALNCPANAIEVSAGVGCAAAFIKARLAGGEAACGGSGGCCC